MQASLINPVSTPVGKLYSFRFHLRQSGLLPDALLDDLEQKEEIGADYEHFVAHLLQQGLLTDYQVERLAEGDSRGLVMGPYHILDKLGRGGFGQVYKAKHVLMNRLVALKVIAPELIDRSDSHHCFLREVQANTRLVHPNIATAFDANEFAGTLCFSMEFVDGPTLEEFILDYEGVVPVPLICAIMRQVAQALQYAWEQKVVHRDIKPRNILLAAGPDDARVNWKQLQTVPRVKVIDFGLARLPLQASHLPHTLPFDLAGTPSFMAPEQARSIHEADIRSDLYSVGCTFYFALSAVCPFDAETPAEILYQQRHVEPKSLQILRPGLHPALVALVRKLMAKQPEQRFQTPGGFIQELDLAMVVSLNAAMSSKSSSRLSQPTSPPGISQRQVEGPRLENAETAVPQAPPAPSRSSCSPCEPEPSSRSALKRTPAAPRSITSNPPRDGTLSRALTTWLTMLTSLLRDEPKPQEAEQYDECYRQLMNALRPAIEQSCQPDKKLLISLAALVEPWLALSSLQTLNRDVLTGLVDSCLDLGLQLRLIERPSKSLFRVGVYLLVVFMVLFFVFIYSNSVTFRATANLWLTTVYRFIVEYCLSAIT